MQIAQRSSVPRVLKLREAAPPSLEGVERRRLQLWALAAFVILAIGLATILAGMDIDGDRFWWAQGGGMRAALFALAVAFVLYATEKELSLRRLTRQLIDERLVTAALGQRVEELRALLAASKAMNSVLEIDEVLHRILSSALELLGGSEGSVMLRRGTTLEAVCVVGNDAAKGATVKVGEGIAGAVAETGEPLLLTGDLPETIRDHLVTSAMSVPLRHRGEILGVLNCNAGDETTYDEYDLRAFTLFAEQAASAIANARLYEFERKHVQKLQALDEMKNDFIASVGHDLRTPLTAIIGSAQVATRGDLAEPARVKLLTTVTKQARRLEEMVQQLLEAASTEAALEDGPRSAMNLADRARLVASGAAVRGIKVDLDVSDDCIVEANDQVDRAIANLIDNAAVHGASPIELTVARDGDRIVCTVVDHGRGIPIEVREIVFERFARADPSRSSSGLGLGLAVTRQIVRALGGETFIGEATHGGAAVGFWLPHAG